MVELTAISGQKILVNLDLVRFVESVPDSILCFQDGSRLPVREKFGDIQKKYFQAKQFAQQESATWTLQQSLD
jgi:uncharacterized protein YlzI (FlbEa/FlbD family)